MSEKKRDFTNLEEIVHAESELSEQAAHAEEGSQVMLSPHCHNRSLWFLGKVDSE